MNEQRLDELLDIALATGELPADATVEERAELAPLLETVLAFEEPAESVATEAAATKPIARARFERFLAEETAPEPAPLVAETPRVGWLGKMFGSSRSLVTSGIVASVVVMLVIVGTLGSDLILSDTSSAYALDAEPGDYLQIDGVVTEVTDSDGGLRLRLQSDGGYIDIDLSGDTSVLEDDEVIDPSGLKVGQQLAVAGLVNDHRRIGAAVLSVQGPGGPPPANVDVDDRGVPDGPIVGNVVSLKFDRDDEHGSVIVKLPNGDVVRYELNGETLTDFITDQGFAPGSEVTLGGSPDGSDGASITPSEQRTAPCQRPSDDHDRHGQGTFCAIVVARHGLTIDLQTPEGIQTVQLVRDSQVLIPPVSGLTRQEVRDDESSIEGHGVQVTGHKRGDKFIVGQIIIGPELDTLPPKPPPPNDRR